MDDSQHQHEFVIPGDPVPQSRPRVTRNGQVYYPPRIVEFRRWVRANATAAHLPVRTGALWLGLEFVFARPASHTLKSGNLSSRASEYPATKGDCTNLAKGVEDALNGIAWEDDSQIVETWTRKRWALSGEEACTVVTICDVHPPECDIMIRRDTVNRNWSKTERESRAVKRQQVRVVDFIGTPEGDNSGGIDQLSAWGADWLADPPD
jgi:Holliday junction resolvase RusA-like endonuclease